MDLTTDHFRQALARQIDALKPDPLARRQMETLRLDWRQAGEGTDAPRMALGPGTSLERDCGGPLRSLCGNLRLASEYLAITIRAESDCKCRASAPGDEPGEDEGGGEGDDDADGDSDTSRHFDSRHFDNEFSMELTVAAECLRFIPPQEGEIDDKELKRRRNLHDGMIKRLKSDPLLRQLMSDEHHGMKHVPLCEAWVQENTHSNTPAGRRKRARELEERVHVNEGALDGIRRAIFGRCEENLDVLRVLLDMPYFLRQSSNLGATAPEAAALAERAYLRLLEEALVDACEREGEDELLDELSISAENDEGGGKRRR